MAGRYTRRIPAGTLDALDEEPLSAGEKKNQGDSDFWRFVGDVAPAAGTALGGVAGALIGGIPTGGMGAAPGAALGASLGGALGQAGGALATGQADHLTAEQEDRRRNQADRKSALLQAFLSMKR